MVLLGSRVYRYDASKLREMAIIQERDTPALAHLQSETLRFTAFLAPGDRLDKSNWFKDLAGVEPETRIDRPTLDQIQHIGTYRDFGLVLGSQASRVDWFLGSRPVEGLLPEKFAGPAPETLSVFSELIQSWLERNLRVNRIAFGAVLHELADNRLEAYRRLAKYLPTVQIDPEHSSDFLYQINRPRMSKVLPELSLNRLAKWSAATFKLLQFELMPNSMPTVSDGTVSCRFELDVNSSPEWGAVLPHESLGSLFRELSDLAVELAANGDKP